ncbi:MAG TPA: methyl-accepting chemotaxis protein [Burkholderiaceae bacterium]|nr:methyl-accepting chemotaxis protein [Burkholderiaceae bacterium]
MRINEPVTQREFDLPDDATLMSTTDTQSRVTCANDAFVAVSGFSREEIHGEPHNIVRHPDMPKDAFADMWATLKGGEPWTALVKNRRKNGDHYWVRANAIPVVRGGRQVGYMSVRTKPTRDEVNSAEALYKDFREGRAGSRRFYKGLIVRTGIRSLSNWRQMLSVRGRIRLSMGVMWIATMFLSATVAGSLAAYALLGGFTGATALLASVLLEWQLAGPLEELRARALAVATGESRDVQTTDRVDEIGMTMRTISQLGLMFRWLVNDVSQQVLAVQTAASEIAQGNHDLSVRTEQAAANVQQTAASMEQMNSTLKSNADTAQHANELSGSSSVAATKGGEAVSQVVSTMNEIAAGSKRIADIIGVIDSIAFQTNILALNAAVEAARAGEQGRGFAVVAAEVRNLAQRSAAAAKEIKDLIGASVKEVEAGARLVDDAGRAMEGIVAEVKRVSGLISEISVSTVEQSRGISQVGQAIDQLDQVTQQNAELVEQSAAASACLRNQAERLVEALSILR